MKVQKQFRYYNRLAESGNLKLKFVSSKGAVSVKTLLALSDSARRQGKFFWLSFR